MKHGSDSSQIRAAKLLIQDVNTSSWLMSQDEDWCLSEPVAFGLVDCVSVFGVREERWCSRGGDSHVSEYLQSQLTSEEKRGIRESRSKSVDMDISIVEDMIRTINL